MSGEHRTFTPFDEQAALEKLERLKLDVLESRKRRNEVSDAFDAFVRSFRTGGRDVTSEPAPVAVAPPAVERTDDRPLPQRAAALRAHLRHPGVVFGSVVVLAAAIVLVRAWLNAPADHPVTTSAAATPTGTARGSSVETQTPPGMLRGELAADRRVWIRATADGVRIVERELQANERVPLRPARTLTIRAGDAGAVRIVIDGRDRGPLGANGTAATRTFTATAAAPR
jgi:Domain of unknown function (DUF4115)